MRLSHFAAFLFHCQRLALGAVLAVMLLAGAQAWAAPVKLVVIGDSLSAGYRLPDARHAFYAQLESALREEGLEVEVINGSFSGSTTQDGLARLPHLMQKHPDATHYILQLGANDALRGQSPARAKEHLELMIASLQQAGKKVMLAGMKAPMNMGPDYVTVFNSIYFKLADQYDLPLYEFFLEGVALNPKLNLPDGIHPNEQGIREMVRRILPTVKKFLQS